MQGIGGPESPFLIRSHLEDHKGVPLQVLLPAGGPVNCARFASPTSFWVSTAEATGNADDARGSAPSSAPASAINKGGAWPGTRDLLHRVVFYGDHVGSIERLDRLTGFEVIHEI